MEQTDQAGDWFDVERHTEVERELRDRYAAMTCKLTDHELRKRKESAAAFKAQFDSMSGEQDQQYQARQLADARRIQKEHRAAVAKYGRAHRERYPRLDAVDVDSAWDELHWAFDQLALLHRYNPHYGGLWAVMHALHDDVFDFFWYAYPALAADEMTARIETEITAVYEGALRRSDAEKGPRGKSAAAPLTPKERDAQSGEIENRLLDLGLDLADKAKRSRILDALIASANEIRRYQTPEEMADKGESIDREGAYRGPTLAAAENIGKILDELLDGLPLGIDGTPLGGLAPRGGRTVMGRVAASKKIRLPQFDSLSLVMRSADAHLRNELRGQLFTEAMTEIAEVIESKREKQRLNDEDRES